MYKIIRVEDIKLKELQEQKYGHTIFLTYPWMNFLKRNQSIESVVLELHDGEGVVAYFVGGIIKKMGVRILGSPFEGWLTCDMGFIQVRKFSHEYALKDVGNYALHELKCMYVQIIDKNITTDDLKSGIKYYEQDMLKLDLSGGKDLVFNNFSKKAKRYIRQCNDRQMIVSTQFDREFVDIYYPQLEEIFARQGLKPTFSKSKICDLADSFKDYPELVCAEKAILNENQDVCTGTALTFGYGGWCYYLCAANNRMGNNCHPGEGLFWSMAQKWMDREIEMMDLVGVRDYKMRYAPEMDKEIVVYFEKVPGIFAAKNLAKKCVEVCRKIFVRGE